MKLRTATKADFKPGAKLIDKKEGWHHILTHMYADGVWETRRPVVAFEGEARFYNVETN